MHESLSLTEDPQPRILALGQAPSLQSGGSSPADQNHLCRVREETRDAAFTGHPAVGQGCMGMYDEPIQAPVAAGCANALSSICIRTYRKKKKE